jgi:hypothetical protein
MRFFMSIALMAMIFGSTVNAIDSIMFTSTEVTMIKGQRQAEKLSQYRKAGCLICNGIMFVDKDNWTVWLNNKMITSRLRRPDIQIHKISADMVSLSWRYKGKDHAVLLRPQQGYDGELRKMID